MAFDEWEKEFSHPESYLMHFRTKGSKNGVRRYQNPDGSWTELGLQERRKREGFGETRKERKEARKQKKAEARAAAAEKRRQNNVKTMTDDELQKKIARLELEQKYKDLNKSSLLKAGANLLNQYFEYKANKDAREERRYNMQTNRLNAMANLRRAKSEKAVAVANAKGTKARAKADRKRAKADIIDNLTFGKGRKDAKRQLIETKEKAKANTLWGILKANHKKAKEAETNDKLYKNNEYFRTETNERRANERDKIKNEELKSRANIELGKGNQEIGKGNQEKAKADRKRKR